MKEKKEQRDIWPTPLQRAEAAYYFVSNEVSVSEEYIKESVGIFVENKLYDKAKDLAKKANLEYLVRAISKAPKSDSDLHCW